LPPVPADGEESLTKISSGKQEAPMKHIATMAMMLNLAVAGVYAQQISVKMTFSGTGGASPIDLKQPNTSTAEENVAGQGTLGQFTLRNVRAIALAPQASSTCAGLFFPSTLGAGQFRFEHGNLLKVTLTQGGDCIDLVRMVGNCTLTFKITGGTGRFKNATGVLTYTETARPMLADGLNNPVFFSETGEIKGTISGLTMEEESQDEQR
jgi:hypothetical protein